MLAPTFVMVFPTRRVRIPVVALRSSGGLQGAYPPRGGVYTGFVDDAGVAGGCPRFTTLVSLFRHTSEAATAVLFFLQLPSSTGEMVVKLAQDRSVPFGETGYFNKLPVCCPRSSLNYMSGLQPSSSTLNLHLGLRPRLVCHGPSALFECTASRGSSGRS